MQVVDILTSCKFKIKKKYYSGEVTKV